MRYALASTAGASFLALALASYAQAGLKTEVLEYTVNDTSFTGYLAYDTDVKGKRPGILVVHEWWGHNEFARSQAEKLAKAGYTAFALDMYGDGKVADHPKDAQAYMKAATSDPAQIEDRFRKAMSLLKSHNTVDSGRIAAQGYCFGGGVVLDMARLGLDLEGVVSYHGALNSSVEITSDGVKARVQVYTGGADKMVPPEQVAAFVEEMMNAGADLSLVSFPGAPHSFMNPGADEVAREFDMPLGYDREAAERSWEGTLEFYQAIF